MVLVEEAARLLAEEGRSAVTARRVTSAAGVSTMAVYTHFGGMEELLAEVWREGFARFGSELERASLTADVVADWMAHGWGYRRFALREPHLYRVMFGNGLASFGKGMPDDARAAMETFLSLVRRLERCVEGGRFRIDDAFLAGEVAWSTVHGHTAIELTGYFDAVGRDAAASFGECLLRMAIGFGDEPDQARASLAKARRRATRADEG